MCVYAVELLTCIKNTSKGKKVSPYNSIYVASMGREGGSWRAALELVHPPTQIITLSLCCASVVLWFTRNRDQCCAYCVR